MGSGVDIGASAKQDIDDFAIAPLHCGKKRGLTESVIG
jgi:hypothetical protein